MYTGHIGVALGARGIRQSIPFWILIAASQLPDWADAAACIVGERSVTPGMYSHSFPAIAVLALSAALLYAVAMRDAAGALVVALLVVSHAAGDYLTGVKPTWPGGPLIGLHLYARPSIDFAVEAVVVLAGWSIYRTSLPRDRRSSTPALALLFVLIAIQIGADLIMNLVQGIKKC
jgi:hypothetical protein